MNPSNQLLKFALGLLVCVQVFAATPPQHPNVILVVVDDLGFADLSCTGLAPDVQTPHMDALAAGGTRYTQAYAMAPICNASRISLATGRYHQRQNQYWYGGPGLHDQRFVTIAEVLRDRGYTTGYVGKFHHGGSDQPDQRGFPLNHGFETFYGFSGGTKHYLRHRREFEFPHDIQKQGPMWVQREQEDVEGFTTQLFGEQARQFITRHRQNKFFLQLSFNAVHNFTHQLPASYLQENGLQGFPDHDPQKEDLWSWRKKIGFPAHPDGRDYYLGQLHYLDQEIGRLMTQLAQLGLRKNTAILLVSDNGGSLVTYANNGPLKGGKYTLFEGGIRVPLIANFPAAFEPGAVNETIVTAMDIFPTICHLADAPEPQRLDGTTLTNLASAATEPPDTRMHFWDTQAEQAVRQGDWKLLVTHKAPNPRLQIVETPLGEFLFNLKQDPGETTDLAAQYPAMVAALRAALNQWQHEMTADHAPTS